MRTLTSVGLVAAFTAGMVLVPMSAKATCTQVIYAERAFSTGFSTTLTGRTTSFSTTFWSGTTANAVLADLIFSAVSQRNRVAVTGNAAACPANGGSVGTIITMVLSP